MKNVLVLLVLVFAVAVAKAALAALLVALLLAMAVAFIIRPGETFLFLGTLTFVGLASAQPTVFIVALGVLGAVALVVNTRPKARGKLLVADRRQDR